VVKAEGAEYKYWSAGTVFYVRAFSASGFGDRLPGALPQAVALRTFGADKSPDT